MHMQMDLCAVHGLYTVEAAEGLLSRGANGPSDNCVPWSLRPWRPLMFVTWQRCKQAIKRDGLCIMDHREMINTKKGFKTKHCGVYTWRLGAVHVHVWPP